MGERVAAVAVGVAHEVARVDGALVGPVGEQRGAVAARKGDDRVVGHAVARRRNEVRNGAAGRGLGVVDAARYLFALGRTDDQKPEDTKDIA